MGWWVNGGADRRTSTQQEKKKKHPICFQIFRIWLCFVRFFSQVALKTTGSLDTFRRSSGELEFNGSVPPLKNIRTVTHLQPVMFSRFYITWTTIFAHIITQATAKRLNLLYFGEPWEIRTTPTLSACLHFPDGLLTTSKEEVETVSHHWHEVSWTSNNRYHVQQRWGVSDSDFFVVKPNEAIVHSLQNIDVPHRSRSRGRELKPRGVTRCCILWFYNSGESAPGKPDGGNQAHLHPAAGVRCIPMTVQIRRGECNHMAPVLSFRDRKTKSSTSSNLRVFKPANHSKALTVSQTSPVQSKVMHMSWTLLLIDLNYWGSM